MPQLLLDRLLQQFPDAKRQTLKRMVEAGRVRINGRPAHKLKQPVGERDIVEFIDRQPAPPAHKHRPPFDVIYEDADLLVVNKPAGLLTSTVPREPRPTLLAQVRQYAAEHDPKARIGLIHRLDRDAAGLLVFSKNDTAYESLKSQFFHHTVERKYLAVVEGLPKHPKGRIKSSLVERADGTVYSSGTPAKGQAAITDYQVKRKGKQRALLEVTLQTGRKHQIRVHLSEHELPIVGDAMYGKQPLSPAPRLMLLAFRLAFTHPRTAKLIQCELPMPDEFAQQVF
ncbi:MAG TPA: RluA family pseudouridine synthase [Tepidisphaeraceae bacterium]|jgi:23S rRNA pseudouridine1911/1915/1917 synthase